VSDKFGSSQSVSLKKNIEFGIKAWGTLGPVKTEDGQRIAKVRA